MAPLIVLIHSPLVGPLTWSRVAEHLAQRGIEAHVPTLVDVEGSQELYWRQHVEAVRQSLVAVPGERALALVGHSGAGALLPAICVAAAPHPVAAYIFADAGLPHGGQSRLEEMQSAVPEFAEELRASLAAGGRFPEWTDADLREILPDASLRRQLLAELRPRPLAFFIEPLPVVSGWPETPCAYIQLSPAYNRAAEAACAAGWPMRAFEAGHFHMLVDPGAVGDAIFDLLPRVASM